MSDFNLLPPRVAVTDPRTGIMSREWYLFFQQVFVRLGGNAGLGLDETLLGTSTGSVVDTSAAVAQQLNLDASQVPPVPELALDQVNYWPAYMPPVAEPVYFVDPLAPPIQVGTLGSQNSDSVAITGGSIKKVTIDDATIRTGTIDNTPIGNTVRNSGKFTTLNTTGISYVGNYIQIKGSSTAANAEAFIDVTDTTAHFYGSSSSGVAKTVSLHATGGGGGTIVFDSAGVAIDGYMFVVGKFGCNGAATQASFPFDLPATDLPTALILVNQIRQALINNGTGY